MAQPVPSFDSIVLAAIARDLDALVGARLSDVTQPASDELALILRTRQTTTAILCSIHAKWARVHLSTSRGGVERGPFAQMLRRRLHRARLDSLRQPPFERTLTLAFETDDGPTDLVVELMGRHSNIILAAGGTIAGSLKAVPRSKSSVREVLPGRPYILPPRDRPVPPEITRDALDALLRESEVPLSKHLVATIQGIGLPMAAELAVRSGLDPQLPPEAQDDAARKVWPQLQELIDTVKSTRFAPVVYLRAGQPVTYAPFPFVHLQSLETRSVMRMSDAVEAVTSSASTAGRLEESRTGVLSAIDAALAKARRMEIELVRVRQEAAEADALRERGDLLLAYASQVPSGAAEVTVPGFDGRPVTIRLQPTLSAVENAQRLFKRYTKLRAARSALDERLRRAIADRQYLESARTMAEQAVVVDDLLELRAELADEGYVRTRRVQPRRGKRTGPRTYELPSGDVVLVGRTNEENDHLTFSVASPDDLWLHARGVPGAHVIMRTGGTTPSEEAVQMAAAITAYFSGARMASTAAVDVTPRKYVRKPKGSKPGMVTYTNERTVHVRPEVPVTSDQ